MKRAYSCVAMGILIIYGTCLAVLPDQDVAATIGTKTITRQDFNDFSAAKMYSPTVLPTVLARATSDLSLLIETELLFPKVSNVDSIKKSNDWKWKEMFYPAQLFYQDVMEPNLGFTDAEINAYYEAHKELYKHVVAVDTAVKDSLGKVVPEHIEYRLLYEVGKSIVDSLFLAQYPVPDSLLRPLATDSLPTVDTALIRGRWLSSARQGASNFFMEAWYKEKFKQNKFPDSLNTWYGEGKIITPADMKVILNWIPEDQRSYYSDEAGTKILAMWLLKWKLFSEKANKAGFYASARIPEVLSWALKMTAVSNYLTSNILPAAQAAVVLDTAMCRYAAWDDNKNPSVLPDSADMSNVLKKYQERLAYIKIDAQLNDLRKQAGVTIGTSDGLRDDCTGDPAALIAQADSARDTGNIVDAETIYRRLISAFSFSQEGLRAYSELAKILTERQVYSEAITSYRDFLVLSQDTLKRSNTFFMIGFIYDEYQDNPELAEVNYRWVLKNAPKSELADDAEFMCLHLGEAMNSVDELRDEAVRQGKKVDANSMQQ
jgi:tetratricopeptide (TPR) repeat protein